MSLQKKFLTNGHLVPETVPHSLSFLLIVIAAAHFFLYQHFLGYMAVETTPYLSGLQQQNSNTHYTNVPTRGQR